MKKNFLKIILYLIFLINIVLLPRSIYGSELFFKLIPNIEDSSTIIEVRINSGLKNLNVVEGVINFSGDIAKDIFADIQIGGSILKMWTIKPKYIKEENIIEFAGGNINGFNKDNLLFTMKIHSILSGNLIISSFNNIAYLSDGLGTKDNVFSKSLSINLEKVEKDFVSKKIIDDKPPYFEFINIGKDKYTYEGKYFITFLAIDEISGISHYEIKENNIITKTTDNVYILKDQNKKSNITIIAYDKMGNSIKKEIKLKFNSLYYVIIILLIFSTLFYLYLYKKRKND